MRICKYLIAAVLLAIVAHPFALRAQESSVNTYSPYTLYGLGNLSRAGNSAFFGMGGASIGFRNDFASPGSGDTGFETPVDTRLNISNPASLSGLAPRNLIFDVGLAGSNVYLKQRSVGETLRTSFNTFNFSNITMAFPIARKLGFAFNVSPYSDVGYRIHTDDTSYIADLGLVRYFYNGEGDVNEARAQIGWEPFKNLSIGAEAIYMSGSIDRTYQAVILDYTGQGTYEQISSLGGATANTDEKVSRFFGAFGVQYTPLDRAKSRLTLGATYRMGGKLRSQITDFIPSNNNYGDTIRFNQMRSSLEMPQSIGAGVYFHRQKWAVGADYIYEDWGRRNTGEIEAGIKYVDTHTFKIGGQFTPNRYDIRGKGVSFFNRITYKVGFRRGNHYIGFDGRSLAENAVTLGFDIPFSAMTVSKVSLGLEMSQRAKLTEGLVRERYFKISVGVMLFGRDYDYWFDKYKYN